MSNMQHQRGLWRPVVYGLAMVALMSGAAVAVEPGVTAPEVPPPTTAAAASAGRTDLAGKATLQPGPGTAHLGSLASLKIPAGFLFADVENTRALMATMQNPATGEELGLVAPEVGHWFFICAFESIGYVRDDEQHTLNPDTMLKAIKEANVEINKERTKRGWPALTVSGWQTPPRYDAATHRLEWAVRGESAGQTVANFNTRMLGRSGVMRVVLAAPPVNVTVWPTKISNVAVTPVLMVKLRSVVLVMNTRRVLLPPKTRLDAAFEDLPIELLEPPLAKV